MRGHELTAREAGDHPGLVLLSDDTIGSYAVVGHLLATTLQDAGFIVDRQRLDADCRRAFRGTKRRPIVIQNTIGPRFIAMPGCRNIAVVHHEWDRYPPAWVAVLNRFEEVWATTEFVKSTLRRSGVRVPLRLVRLALDLETVPAKRNYQRHGPYRFLARGEAHFRKGFHLLFDGFCQAFPTVGKAQLHLHTSASCDWTPPRADITIRCERLTRDDVLASYREFDAFVSTSLGEGLGLPVAEAILAGIPVVTNDWGGHRSLVTPGAFFRIRHEVVPQPYCSRPEYYAPGQRCAVSHASAVAAALRSAVTTPAATTQRMTEMAREGLLGRYGRRAARSRLRTVMATLGRG
jgi:glycosyltransferase involved in cell wall biosynthesis